MSRLSGAFLLMVFFTTIIRAATPAPVVTLAQKIQSACQEQSLPAIKSCYCLKGASQEQIDLQLSVWQEYFGKAGDNKHYQLTKTEYRSLDEILADKTVNSRAIEMRVKPHKMGDSLYEPNLKIIGFLTVTFRNGSSSIGTVQAVGIGDDGLAYLSLDRSAK
jgi:hypothetical protein